MENSYIRDGVSLPIKGKILTASDTSTDTDLGTSETALPVQNAVKQYVDAHGSGGGVSVNKIMAYITSY